jgi:hypothetical protein
MAVLWVLRRVIFWLYTNVSNEHTSSTFRSEDGGNVLLQNDFSSYLLVISHPRSYIFIFLHISVGVKLGFVLGFC